MESTFGARASSALVAFSGHLGATSRDLVDILLSPIDWLHFCRLLATPHHACDHRYARASCAGPTFARLNCFAASGRNFLPELPGVAKHVLSTASIAETFL